MTDSDVWRACPFQVQVGVRHFDLDIQKNINNVAIGEIFEEARTQYSINRKLKGAMDPNRRVLDNLSIRFVADGRYPGALDLHGGVASVNGDGWILRLFAVQNGTLLAVNDCTFRLVDGDGQGVPLSHDLVRILEQDLIAEN